MNKIKKLWLDLNSSLWFLPGLIVAGSIMLALVLVEFDKQIGGNWINGYPRLFGVEPSGSRDMLVDGRRFDDYRRRNRFFDCHRRSLARFDAIHAAHFAKFYARPDQSGRSRRFRRHFHLLHRRSANDSRRRRENVFVPSIAVIVGVLLALVGIGFLIYFIHHIAVSIQASTIIAAICDETIAVIDELFPHRLGENAPDEEIEKLEKFAGGVELANDSGDGRPAIFKTLTSRGLLDLTKKREIIVRMEHGVGEFVVAGAPLASVARSATREQREFEIDEDTIKRLNRIYAIDNFRTIDQDVAFGIRQIVDIMMKALSPGINDTTTAVICD